MLQPEQNKKHICKTKLFKTYIDEFFAADNSIFSFFFERAEVALECLLIWQFTLDEGEGGKKSLPVDKLAFAFACRAIIRWRGGYKLA